MAEITPRHLMDDLQRDMATTLGRMQAERAFHLDEAQLRINEFLVGEWNGEVAKVCYADLVRYQRGIDNDACENLAKNAAYLAVRANNEGDTESAEYFNELRRGWVRVLDVLRNPTREVSSQ